MVREDKEVLHNLVKNARKTVELFESLDVIYKEVSANKDKYLFLLSDDPALAETVEDFLNSFEEVIMKIPGQAVVEDLDLLVTSKIVDEYTGD